MISFIIPAFNEEGVIGNTIKAINQHCLYDDKEVIVVDNGSTDKTSSEATSLGARVLSKQGGTIASVRNYGVSKSKGDILIFIDADVILTEEWQNNINAQIEQLRLSPYQVTGSRCHPPNNGNWFNVHWYQHMTTQTTSYINSGHLITTKLLFDKVSGFTESLKTAEDYDFCQKALASNATITPNFNLVTIHDGYPKSLKHFIQRERWHGKEDFQSFKTTLSSKVAIIAIINLMLFIASVIYSIYTFDITGCIFYILIMTAISMALTVIKFKRISMSMLSHSSAIHFIYIWGRSLALLDRLFNTKINRFREQG